MSIGRAKANWLKKKELDSIKLIEQNLKLQNFDEVQKFNLELKQRQSEKDKRTVLKLIKSTHLQLLVKQENLDLAIKLYRNIIIDKDKGCWFLHPDWTYYPTIEIDGKTFKGHRLSFELFFGPLNDLLCCHRCDRPGCINPLHLFKGTNKDNLEDAYKKGRRYKTNQIELKKLRKLRREDSWKKLVRFTK